MPAPSKLARFFSPDEQLKLAQFLRENPTVSVDDFRALLAERGLDVGRSTAHEYQQKLGALGDRLRQSRLVAETLARDLGDAATEGEYGRVLVEVARTLIFEFQQKQLEGNQLDARDFAFLGKALKELAQAARLDQDFETKVRELRAVIRAEERTKAADDAGTAMREAGLDENAVKFWREKFLGVRRPKEEPPPEAPKK